MNPSAPHYADSPEIAPAIVVPIAFNALYVVKFNYTTICKLKLYENIISSFPNKQYHINWNPSSKIRNYPLIIALKGNIDSKIL